MISDKELWACATWLEEHQGDQAPHFITERMIDLAQKGDTAGVNVWKAISDRYDQLHTGRRGPLPV